MNKRWKDVKKPIKSSPVLFEDEEVGTSSPNDVRTVRLSGTPHRSRSLADHSTPIKSKNKIDSSDSPDLMLESPIEPLTQNPPNEVGWDYQRVLSKEEQDGAASHRYMDINRTPKRSDLLSKKRNSNSPLLYKPLKKKLIQEQQENLVGFMAELKAIEFKTKQDEEKVVAAVQKTDDDLESQLVVEMDSDQRSNDSDIKLQVSANSDESVGQNKVTAKLKNYDALLDDSIEDIMVLCSQQVEAKEFGLKIVQPVLRKNPDKSNTKNSSTNSLEKMFDNLAKENVQPSNTSDKINSDVSSEKSGGKTESGSLEIPDDSFDEFFVGIDEQDFCKNTEIVIDGETKSVKSHKNVVSTSSSSSSTTAKPSVPQNKFFQSKKPVYTAEPKSVTSTTTTSIYTPRAQSSSVPTQSKVANSKANFGYLNREYVKNSSGYESQSSQSSISSNNTRLVKAKSFSDSNFLENSSGNSLGNHRSNSNLNADTKLNSGHFVNQNTGSSSNKFGNPSENKSWRRTNSSSHIDDRNKWSNVNSGKSYSTPAEIERKRQEALMKRKAKMTSDTTTQRRPIQDSIKR